MNTLSLFPLLLLLSLLLLLLFLLLFFFFTLTEFLLNQLLHLLEIAEMKQVILCSLHVSVLNL